MIPTLETPAYPDVPEGEDPPSMYWDDTEDSVGYKEDGTPWVYTE